MRIRIIRGLALTVSLGFTVVATTANAVPILYGDRANFDADASGLSFESFETAFSATTQPLDLGDFVIAETAGLPDFRSLTHPQLVTDGERALTFFADDPLTEVTITFANPINALGIDISDFGVTVGDLIVLNDTGSFSETLASGPLPQSGGNNIFFGVIDSQPFTSLIIQVTTGSLDAVALDALAYGNTLAPIPVPAPTPGWLLVSGLVAVMLLRRCRSSRKTE